MSLQTPRARRARNERVEGNCPSSRSRPRSAPAQLDSPQYRRGGYASGRDPSKPGCARPDYFFGTLPTPRSLTVLSGPDSRLVSIVIVPLYFCAAVGVKVTETSQLPAGIPLPLGPRSSSSQT